ncbi:hypothetical protein PPACK8108_LOCUS20336 [Phakopsora pachyrhizi]|uniref:Uncharacterized protein n=1 Tax=Phakopsora pachyrhizi TaxID=170000 RepID=A0AAV0BF25_PHAPC|nr:hypothetical protein PPACK8108_LOCUS20336 [Phakopsora pachyrhizi]
MPGLESCIGTEFLGSAYKQFENSALMQNSPAGTIVPRDLSLAITPKELEHIGEPLLPEDTSAAINPVDDVVVEDLVKEEEGMEGCQHWNKKQKLGGGAHQGQSDWSKTTGARDL